MKQARSRRTIRIPRYGSTLDTLKPSQLREELTQERWQEFVKRIDEDSFTSIWHEPEAKRSIPWFKLGSLDELIELEDGEVDMWETIPDPYRSIKQQVKELIVREILWDSLSLRELKVCLWLHMDGLSQRQVAIRLSISQQAVQQINRALKGIFHSALAGKPVREVRKSATEAGSCASLLVRYHIENPRK